MVRILKYGENSINARGIVQTIYPDGRVWVVNLNMPFAGTVSDIFSPSELKLERK